MARGATACPKSQEPLRCAVRAWQAYGRIPYRRESEAPIFLWRSGRRCQWRTEAGADVGPEQSNVAPAVAWALSNGYRHQEHER